jgi:peptide/nickel transport system substrate-binding protein
VRIILSEPFAPFPSRLTGRLGAESRHCVGQWGTKFNEASRDGPFKFVQFRSDSHVRLAGFENYWRQGPMAAAATSKVEFRVITEAANRLTALQAGDIHTTSLREADIPIAKKDSNIVIEQGPGFGWGGIWLTINTPPFDNRAMRQAVAYAIDRDAINKAIYEGQRTIAYGPIPPVLSWAVTNFKPYLHDLNKAPVAGRAAGQRLRFEYWISVGDAAVAPLN